MPKLKTIGYYLFPKDLDCLGVLVASHFENGQLALIQVELFRKVIVKLE